MPSGSHEERLKEYILINVLKSLFGKYTKDSINLEKSRKILDKEHYGFRQDKG